MTPGRVGSGRRVRVILRPPTAPARLLIGDPIRLAVVVYGVVAAVILVMLRAGGTVTEDGAEIVAERLPATVDSLMMPYHQHWNLLPILLWDVVGRAFGFGAFMPLMIAQALTHSALASAMTLLLIERCGRAAGLALGLPLVLFGASTYNLIMPWQILFSGTLLASLIVVWVSLPTERTFRRRWVVIAASVAAVATSGVGLFVLLGLGIWFLRERRRRQLTEIAPAALLWAAWFLSYGVHGLGTNGNPADAAVVPYVATAVASAAGMGLGTDVGKSVLVGLAAVSLVRRPGRGVTSFLVAIVAMYLAAALFRSYGTADQATTERYVYLGWFLALFGLALDRPRIRARCLPILGVVLVAINILLLFRSLP